MATETGDWSRTSPAAVIIFIGRFLRRVVTDGLPALAPLAAAFATVESLRWYWLALGGLVFCAGLLVWSILSYLRFQFRLGNHQILVRQGVLLHEQQTVRFERVQNVSIEEPFFMRPMKLAVVTIDTAGSQGKEIILGGIDRDRARRLRETILAESRPGPETSAETEAEPGESPAEELLVERSPRAIARYGLTAATLLWIAVALGFVASIGEEWWTPILGDFVKDTIMTAVNRGDFTPVFATAGIGLLILLALPALSVAGALVQHYGYRLTVEGTTYRRRSGLLSHREESLRQHKIQTVVWKQNFMARKLGLVNLKLHVTRAGTAQTANASGIPVQQRAFLVPALQPAEAVSLTAHFMPGCEAGEISFSRVNARRYIGKALLFGWTPPIMAAGLLSGLLVHWAFLALIPLGYGLAFLIMLQLWRRYGYAVIGEYGFVRSGFVGTTMTAFPLYKIQRMDSRQTPGQRRKSLAHMSIHLAAETLTLPEVALADVERFRDLGLYYAESTQRLWY